MPIKAETEPTGRKAHEAGAKRKYAECTLLIYDEGTENESNDEIGCRCLNRHVGRYRLRDPSRAKYGCCPEVGSLSSRVGSDAAV